MRCLKYLQIYKLNFKYDQMLDIAPQKQPNTGCTNEYCI